MPRVVPEGAVAVGSEVHTTLSWVPVYRRTMPAASYPFGGTGRGPVPVADDVPDVTATSTAAITASAPATATHLLDAPRRLPRSCFPMAPPQFAVRRTAFDPERACPEVRVSHNDLGAARRVRETLGASRVPVRGGLTPG